MPVQNNDLLVSTIERRRPQATEQISKRIALFHALKKAGRYKPHKGGRSIREDHTMRENAGFSYFSGYEKLPTGETNVLSFSEVDIKQAVAPIPISDIEEVLNTGDSKYIDIMAERGEATEITMQNRIGGEGLYSDGSGYGGKQIYGLQYWISTSPSSGVTAGITRSGAPWWQNQKLAATSDLLAPKSAANFKTGLGRLDRMCTPNSTGRVAYFADDEDFTLFEQSQQAIQRVKKISEDSAVQVLTYMGSDFYFDGGLGGACPANTTFRVDLDAICLYYVEGRAFNALPSRTPHDQATRIVYQVFYGNTSMTSLRTSGVFTA